MALAKKKGVDTGKKYHVNFFNLMRELSGGRHEFDLYKCRIVETAMREFKLEDIILKPGTASAFDTGNLPNGGRPVLGAAKIELLDGQESIPFNFYFHERGKKPPGAGTAPTNCVTPPTTTSC